MNSNKEGQLPVRARRYKFCDCVGEVGKVVHVKDWIGVFSVVYTTFRENDRDEMQTCATK
jgi:hypothetical protein